MTFWGFLDLHWTSIAGLLGFVIGWTLARAARRSLSR